MELQEEIKLLIKNMPELDKPLRPDIFSISGFPHYEVVLSNWFAYFFESENNHGLTGLFADAFAAAIQKKNSDIKLDWLNDQVQVIQEKLTENRNFIDLVVYDGFDETEKSYENALIIEHKVEAALYNDLTDYYNSIKVLDNKCGIVLSARPIQNLGHKRFINITYKDFLEAFKAKAGYYVAKVNAENLGYLKDFINNLERMSKETNLEALKFCFEHGESIDKVTELRQKTIDDLAELIRISLESTEYRLYRKYPGSVSLRTFGDKGVVIISIDKLFSQKECKFQYWLNKEAVQQWNNVPNHQELEKQFGHHFEIREKKEGKEWVELIRGTLDFSAETNLHKSFNTLLVAKLHDEINPITEFVEGQIKEYN
jgi:hypothetical protein